MKQRNDFRIPGMALSGMDIAILNTKNPWLPMWWSAAMPGLGHLCQGMYIKGLLLMFWEVLVNLKAHLNLAILYTFTGQWPKAMETINTEWAIIYGSIFVFAIYDSYRTAVELNLLARLGKTQRRRYFKLISLSPTSLGYLDKNNPWVAMAWSALFTGFGHLYNKKSVKAGILVAWAAAIIHFSHVNDGIIATFTGQFHRAGTIVDYQWLLFFPSLYVFAMWDSYNDAVQMNRLFGDAQKDYLQRKYKQREDRADATRR